MRAILSELCPSLCYLISTAVGVCVGVCVCLRLCVSTPACILCTPRNKRCHGIRLCSSFCLNLWGNFRMSCWFFQSSLFYFHFMQVLGIIGLHLNKHTTNKDVYARTHTHTAKIRRPVWMMMDRTSCVLFCLHLFPLFLTAVLLLFLDCCNKA